MADLTNFYELMYVINPVLSEEQTRSVADRVRRFIEERGGQIEAIEERGSQRLAYPIQKKKNGYYVLVYFRAAGDMIAQLDRSLRINDDVLRHMVLRYDAKMLRHYERVKTEQANAPAPAPAPAAEETEEAEA